MRRLVLPLLVLVGCGGGSLSASSPEIAAIEPGFGPVAGGVNITITGEGFLADGAPPNRVLIGDVEAPLAAAVDDTTLVVTLPPGEPGAQPITVFNRNGQARAEGMFRYSEAPTISGLSPADVLYNSTSTTVTLTGTGFQSEDAGPATVLVDGKPAVDVTVVSDTQITFTALPGTVLDTPAVRVVNNRGEATRERGFRYIFSANPTLMVFTRFNPDVFMYLVDPLADEVLAVPNKLKPQGTPGIRAMSRDGSGALRVALRNGQVGELDLSSQQITTPLTSQARFDDFEYVNNVLFATLGPNNGSRFGRVDPETQEFTEISTQPGFGSQELAYNGTTLYYSFWNRSNNTFGIQTINPTTGARGTPVTYAPPRRLTGTKFVGTSLFGVTVEGELVDVNLTTGALTTLKTFQSQLAGIEVFQ